MTHALYSLENIDSITLVNCNYAIDKNAFQYGDFSCLTISCCELKIEKSAFSSCENLISVVFTDSILETEEYAFYSCSDSAKVEMTNCLLTFDDRAFQYCKKLETVNVGNGNNEIGKTVFSGCSENLIITFAGDNYTVDAIKNELK